MIESKRRKTFVNEVQEESGLVKHLDPHQRFGVAAVFKGPEELRHGEECGLGVAHRLRIETVRRLNARVEWQPFA